MAGYTNEHLRTVERTLTRRYLDGAWCRIWCLEYSDYQPTILHLNIENRPNRDDVDLTAGMYAYLQREMPGCVVSCKLVNVDSTPDIPDVGWIE